MLVDGLPLSVVVWIQQAIWAGESLSGFIRFKAHVADTEIVGLLLVSHAAVAEHEIVICLQVLRINRQDGLKLLDGLRVISLEKENSSKIIERHAVARIL